MKKFYISYKTKDNDYTIISVNAENKDNATNIAYHEYKDIDEIVDIYYEHNIC